MEVSSEKAESGFAAAGFGIDQKPDLWIGGEGKLEKPLHVAITTKSRASVDAFYRAALSAGGKETERRACALTIIRTTTARSCWIRTATISRRFATPRCEPTARRSVRRAAIATPGAYALIYDSSSRSS